jgi:hypothetical protein
VTGCSRHEYRPECRLRGLADADCADLVRKIHHRCDGVSNADDWAYVFAAGNPGTGSVLAELATCGYVPLTPRMPTSIHSAPASVPSRCGVHQAREPTGQCERGVAAAPRLSGESPRPGGQTRGTAGQHRARKRWLTTSRLSAPVRYEPINPITSPAVSAPSAASPSVPGLACPRVPVTGAGSARCPLGPGSPPVG